MAAFLEDTVSELPAEDGIYTDSVNDQIDDRVSDNINVSLPAEANAESMMRPSQLAGLTSMQNIQIPQNFIPQIPADINATSSMPDLTILARLTDIRLLDRILRLGSTNRVHPLQEPQQQHHEQHELEEEAEEQPNQAERFSQHPSQVVHNIEDTSFNIDDDLTEPLIPQSRDDEVQQLGHVQQQHDQEHVSEAQSTRDVEMNNNEDQERANVEEHLQGLRQNTNPLKEKLIYRRRAMEYLGETDRQRSSIRCCEGFRHITWPRMKTHLKNIQSYRLWGGHLKQVECHFGSSVASYFIFLRWLFYVNLLIFFLWFCVVCVPQIVLYSYHGLDRTDMTSCAFEVSTNATCSSNSSARNNSGCSLGNELTFTIHSCLINDEGTAYRQNKTQELTLYRNCSSVRSTEEVHIVCYDVQTHYEWYEYILDFVTGSGIYNQTILFYGAYSFEPIGHFHFDLAFILMVGVIYILSIILLVYKMGHAYNESYGFVRRQTKLNFSNRVYCAWDFNITEVKTANLRRAYNRTNFLEESSDARSRATTRSWKKILMIYFVRFCTNVTVLLLLGGAGVAIYFSTEGQLKLQQDQDIINQISDGTVREIVILLVGYLTSVVISILNVLYPFVFSMIAKLEYYKSSSTRVSMTLIRTIFVRLSSLMLLLISLYRIISRCVSKDYILDSTTDSQYGECSLDSLTKELLNSSQEGNNVDCPECWETYIGQQFFKLALLNGVITVGTTIFIETGRNLLSHCVKKMNQEESLGKYLGKYLGKIIQRGHFNIPNSILDLIYTQTLMWLGFLFSPLLPLIVVLTSVALFYTKKISLIYNLEPDKKSFTRSARTNFLFLLLLLLSLFLSIVPVFFAATILKPSEKCGPFRGLSTMYQAITDLIQGWPCTVQIVVDFFNSAAFVVPFITFLLLALYGLYVQLQVKSSQYKVMTKQIQLEGADVRHLLRELQRQRQVPNQRH